MLRFCKGREPRGALARWRSTPGATWDSLGAKDRDPLREALLRDQGRLCCYCQRRIRPDRRSMRIEHWAPRSGGAGHLRWRNLLGACAGRSELGDGGKEQLHCDVRKADTPLYIHPVVGEGLDPRDHLRYLGNGKVVSDDDRATTDIGTLNLNANVFVRGRRSVIDALRGQIHAAKSRRTFLRSRLDRIDRLAPGEEWPEHVEVARYYLERWLRKEG